MRMRNAVKKQILKKLLNDGLKTDADVHMLLAALGDPVVGTKHICDNKDHQPVFRVFSDVIRGLVLDYLLWANRAGSKTYLFGGLITWYKSCHLPLYETRILGGAEGQSKLAYKAMNDFWRISGLKSEYLKHRSLISRSEWKNGSEVEILAASQTAVRGPHPQSLLLDEVDEIDWEIYQAALSQPLSKHGHPASLGIFSTNHNLDGTMGKVLEIAETDDSWRVYKYCIWETLESCKDYNCSTCPISSICPGTQMKEADGYYKIKDLAQKLKVLSWDTFEREWSCNKVGRGDLVYQNEYHDGLLVNVPFNPNLPVTLSIDWGGTVPFSIGAWQKVPNLGHVRIAEIYMGNTTSPKLIKACRECPWWKNVKKLIPDPARPDLIEEWEDAFKEDRLIVEIAIPDNDVEVGVSAVKAAMSPVSGAPTIFFNRSCSNITREMQSYKVKNGKIVKKNDHAVDDTRYYVMEEVVEQSSGVATTYDKDITPR